MRNLRLHIVYCYGNELLTTCQIVLHYGTLFLHKLCAQLENILYSVFDTYDISNAPSVVL